MFVTNGLSADDNQSVRLVGLEAEIPLILSEKLEVISAYTGIPQNALVILGLQTVLAEQIRTIEGLKGHPGTTYYDGRYYFRVRETD